MALADRYTITPIFAGCTVVILAGGPSLSLRQIREVARARMAPASKVRVIAVNDAIYGAWWADWHHACDESWIREHIQGIHTFPGIRTTLAEDVPRPWVTGYLENTGTDGFDEDPSRCRTGKNSGYQAMHIAIHAGAHRIALLGFDMRDASNGEGHWFGEHRDGRKANYAEVMVPHFKTLQLALAARGISVYNCTPGSALKVFPAATLQGVLSL